ncbi:Xaa-Pro peptidase family protein [Fructilactobacillus myrtifloralis]|uniref:Xaa-Pro peptidase family protein n=1 Tax=Fructilactobacillus myrtifloralis TaxID=2940301 RepID=A0ABY5BMT2_9LACO|nr:Xaa-Pro peptidase family protein [Fructilactobacillus myrtifloralis]USS84988.1 Xaa-Pro peptidase family protein [Fructilactobacillus myrtifloralis]
MEKLAQLQAQLQQQNVEVAYLSDPETIQYLTGFGSDPVERVLALVVFPDQEPFIFAPALEVEDIQTSGWQFPVYGYLDHEAPFELLAGHIRARIANPNRWGIQQQQLTVARLRALQDQFPQADFSVDLTPTIERMRLIKTPDEIDQLRAAGREADFAFEVAFKTIAPGKTEAAVAAEIEYQLKQRGVMEMSFATLVQAGKHASQPHGDTGMTKIQEHELVLLDLGTVHNGYISDASRTVAVGTLDDQLRTIYQVCLDAQLAAQAAVRPGITAAELDQVARDVIDQAGYGQYFIHRLGHGIGMSEHEFPSIMEGNDLQLAENMCFSLEPGIYIPGVAGVRIEDCVRVTVTGCEPFTHTTKTLQDVLR